MSTRTLASTWRFIEWVPAGLKVLPVVSRNDVTKVEGVVTLEDILRVYGLDRELAG